MQFDKYYDDDKYISKLLEQFTVRVTLNPSGGYTVKIKNGLGGIWKIKPRLSKSTAYCRAKELREKFNKWDTERIFKYLKKYMQKEM